MTPRTALVALAAVTLARLAVAAITPLSPDEAYYWVWSHALAPGYPDHPPMVALWIRAGTWLAGDTKLGVRLLGPLSAALGSLALADAANRLFPQQRPGLLAAALLNATLLFGVGTVTMTPDTPLIFFWTLCLWPLARLATGDSPLWWLALGLAAGLALTSKYTAALLAPALLLWLLLTDRSALLRWPLWAGAALAALIFAPTIAWNAGHHWVSFLKQGGRVADFNPARALQFEAELLGSQLGLVTPGLFVLCAAGTARATRLWRLPAPSLLACLTLVPTAVFLQHALGDRVQGNWPCLLYPQAAIAAAALLTEPRWRRWFTPSMALGLALTFLVWLQAALAPLPLPVRADPTLLRLGGWRGLAQAVAAEADRTGASYIAAENYGEASLLAFLLPHHIILGLDKRWADFALPNASPHITNQPGLLLRSARRTDPPNQADWSSLAPLPDLARSRHGMVAERYRLYRVTGRPGPTPVVRMP